MVAADVPQVGMSSFILDVSTADFSHLGISGTREGALHRIVFTSH